MAEPSYFNPTTNRYFQGRRVVIEELTRIVLDKHGYGPKRLAWLAEANLAHDDDRARIRDRRWIRAEVVRLWRNFVRLPKP